MEKILGELREELVKNSDEKYRIGGQRYFKHIVQLYGVKSAKATQIARDFYAKIKDREKKDIFGLCEALWQSGYLEESFIACHCSYAMRKRYTRDDFRVFESWVGKYVNNWASCDTLCNHNVGTLVEKDPSFLADLKRWAHSQDLWMRRAAAVSLIVPAKRGLFLEDIFEIAGILLHDKEDMVQKGYGWMLKAASHTHTQEVFDFVVKHKATMPRTALRYAIEKMPAAMRAEAMTRDEGRGTKDERRVTK